MREFETVKSTVCAGRITAVVKPVVCAAAKYLVCATINNLLKILLPEFYESVARFPSEH